MKRRGVIACMYFSFNCFILSGKVTSHWSSSRSKCFVSIVALYFNMHAILKDPNKIIILNDVIPRAYKQQRFNIRSPLINSGVACPTV